MSDAVVADEVRAPLFTIIIATLNAQRYLAEALDSVISQTFDDYELIVVDGASTDSTLQIVADYRARFSGRMKLVSQADDGIYDAMNSGIELASGRYLHFLGADDRLMPDALKTLAAVANDTPDDFICGSTRVFGDRGFWIELPEDFGDARMPKRAPARHQSIFALTAAVRAAGGFDTRYRIAADYDLYLKLRERGATVRLIEPVLSEFRLGGVSSRSLIATAAEYRRVRIAHGANPLGQTLVMLKSVLAASVAAARRGGAMRGERS